MLKVAYIIIVLVIVGGLIGTLMLTGKSDENYSSATGGNLTRIFMLYVLLGIVILVGAVFVIFYLF